MNACPQCEWLRGVNDRLRVELAAVTEELADRNDAMLEAGRSTAWRLRAEKAEARLAAVIARVDAWDAREYWDPYYHDHHPEAFAQDVHAAAMGDTK